MNLYKNFFCEVCNKNRGRNFDHTECSKKLQKSKPKVKANKPTVLTEKRINSFIKYLDKECI